MTDQFAPTPDRLHDDCKAIFVLERRVNAHAQELKELKGLLHTNNERTKEILDMLLDNIDPNGVHRG